MLHATPLLVLPTIPLLQLRELGFPTLGLPGAPSSPSALSPQRRGKVQGTRYKVHTVERGAIKGLRRVLCHPLMLWLGPQMPGLITACFPPTPTLCLINCSHAYLSPDAACLSALSGAGGRTTIITTDAKRSTTATATKVSI